MSSRALLAVASVVSPAAAFLADSYCRAWRSASRFSAATLTRRSESACLASCSSRCSSLHPEHMRLEPLEFFDGAYVDGVDDCGSGSGVIEAGPSAEADAEAREGVAAPVASPNSRARRRGTAVPCRLESAVSSAVTAAASRALEAGGGEGTEGSRSGEGGGAGGVDPDAGAGSRIGCGGCGGVGGLGAFSRGREVGGSNVGVCVCVCGGGGCSGGGSCACYCGGESHPSRGVAFRLGRTVRGAVTVCFKREQSASRHTVESGDGAPRSSEPDPFSFPARRPAPCGHFGQAAGGSHQAGC